MYGDDAQKTNADGCAILQDGDCSPGQGATCKAHWEKMQAKGGSPQEVAENKVAWWIFEAVKGMHSFMSEYFRQLQKETTALGLKIDKMVEDFDASNEAKGNMMEYINMAVDVATSQGAKGLSAYGLIQETMMNSINQEPQPITGALKDSLASVFERTTEAVERGLRAATGSAHEDWDYDFLPWNGKTFESSRLASYFNTGAFLTELDKAGMATHAADTAKNLERRIVMDMLDQRHFFLLVNDKKVDWNDCHVRRGGFGYGLRYFNFDGKDWCVQMMEKVEGAEIKAASDDTFHLMESHGIDIQFMYSRIMDCAMNSADGESRNVDLNTMNPTSGDVPRCFYDLRVVKNYLNEYHETDSNRIFRERKGSYQEFNPRPNDDWGNIEPWFKRMVKASKDDPSPPDVIAWEKGDPRKGKGCKEVAGCS